MDFQSGKSFGKLRYRAFQPYHQILYILKHVGDVRDRSSTPKGCNAMYVGDIGDRNDVVVFRRGVLFISAFWYVVELDLWWPNGIKIYNILRNGGHGWHFLLKLKSIRIVSCL